MGLEKIKAFNNSSKTDLKVLSSQLAEKSNQVDLNIEKGRIDNIVANVGNTSGNTEIVDIRVGQDGITYASAGSAVRTQLGNLQNKVTNFNGYDLTRNKPITDDVTTSRVDGVYYQWGQSFNNTPANLGSVYSGIVQNIVAGLKYRVTVYFLGAYTLNYLNFYKADGSIIARDGTNYGYTVIDEANKIIEVTAPPLAVTMTYTDYLTNKSKGYCHAILNKLNVDWLEVNNNNLDSDTKNTLQSINNSFTLTTSEKLSNNIVSLYDWGYYLDASGGHVTSATMGTTYFDVVEGQKYKMKVYSLTAILTNNAVIYFWNNLNQKITQASYVYTVIDEANKIIEITAPVGAIRGTTTYLVQADYFVYQVGGKTSYDWLVIKESNLSEALKNKTINQLKYGHSLNKPFDFASKSLVCFGDSITAGSTSPSLEVTLNPYCKIFADKFSMNFVNMAVGGSYICDTVSEYSILNRILNYTTQKDFILIAGGTNDWTNGKPVGVYGDTTGATFYGALHLICEHLKTVHPNAKVIFITPINQNVSRPNAITVMDTYRNAIFEVATGNGFNVVDGTKIGFPKEQGDFANVMCSDGVHPSELGHGFYAKSLCGILS